MAIKDLYLELNNKPFSKEVLNAYMDLRKDAKLAGNSEYFYLCGLKIVDIYLEFGSLIQAIELLNKDLDRIDPVTFKNIYVAMLERVIYAYIKKGNFKLAYKFINEKRKYIDNRDHDKVNRWYIEMAYVYGEMGQATKALSCLNAVKENLPDDSTLSYVLSNITKIYIDQNMLDEAKNSLQEALRITTDNEGITYCNYLLAKILLMEGNFLQASELFDSIFNVDNISEDYLGISNEYIAELLKHNELQKAKELLKKTSRDVAKCNDDRIKKYYLLNKVKYIALSLELNNIVDIVSEIDKLEKTITNNDSSNLLEALEDEKAFEVNDRISHFVNNIEKVNLLNNISFNELSLRDNIYNYAKKLEEIISYEQISICLFDKMERLAFLNQNNDFYTYDYHKQRLYERSLDYSYVDKTVLEKIISTNDSLTFDLKNVNLPIMDFNTGKSLQEEGINYCLALPYQKNNSLSIAVIFYTKFIDITSLENEILLKIASSILVNKINEWQLIENERFDLTINNYLDNNNYAMIHNNDDLFINRNLASLLGINANSRYTYLKLDDFVKLITNNSNIDYVNCFKDSFVDITYALKSTNKVLVMNEKAYLLNYMNKTIYYSVLALDDKKIEVENQAQSDQVLFNNYIDSLIPKTKELEFKFSFIRLASPKDTLYTKEVVKNVTGAKCYHLDDETYAVILENEVNQRTLERIIKEMGFDAGVVRFPRDLVDLDDIVKFSKICLEAKETFFSEDVYKAFLDKETISKIIDRVIRTDLEFMYMRLGTYLENNSYEVRLNIPGVSLDQDIRKLVDEKALHKYELKILENFKPLNNNDLYYINTSFSSLNDYINNSDCVRIYQNVIYVVDNFDQDYSSLIKTFNKQHINCIVEYKVLDKLPTNLFLHSYISGIAVFEGLEQSYRHSLIEFVSKIDFPIYANYQFLDYDKCIYRKDIMLSQAELVNGN